MLAQRLADAKEIVARLGGRCAAEYKYDGVRVQAHRTADGRPRRAQRPAAFWHVKGWSRWWLVAALTSSENLI